MTNEEKAREITNGYFEHVSDIMHVSGRNAKDVCIHCAELMAKWKDKQLCLLIDAIDHAYLQTDGTYGDLCYEVSDKVRYLKNILKQPLK